MYPRLLESVLLPAYDRARGRRYVERRRFLERSQWWSADRVREFQWAELKKLLAHVFASVPYLQRQIPSRRHRPRGSEGMGRLPPAAAADASGGQRPPSGSVLDRLHGPIAPARDGWIDRRARPAFSGPTRATTGGRPRRTARIRGPAGAWESRRSTSGAHPSAPSRGDRRLKTRAYEAIQRQLIVNTFSQSDELWDDVYARALKFRPVLVVGYVSSLEAFAAYLRRTPGRRFPASWCAIAAAEPLHEDARAAHRAGTRRAALQHLRIPRVHVDRRRMRVPARVCTFTRRT